MSKLVALLTTWAALLGCNANISIGLVGEKFLEEADTTVVNKEAVQPIWDEGEDTFDPLSLRAQLAGQESGISSSTELDISVEGEGITTYRYMLGSTQYWQ